MSLTYLTALVVLVVLSGVILQEVLFSSKKRTTPPLPPRPEGSWIQGNEVPPRQWLKFYEYTKELGPLFSLRLHRQLVIVIGTYEAAWDIMDKEGSHLVDRPRCIAANDILSGGMRILLLSNGDRLKRLRKALHALLQPKMAEKYQIFQAKAARNLLLDIIKRPDDFQDHAKRYAASVIISLTFGKPTASSYSEPEVRQINQNLPILGRALKPGRYAVDSYPFLKYIPWYLPELRKQHQVELKLFTSMYQSVKDKMDEGDLTPSFARHIIENKAEYGLSDSEAAYLCGTLFGAGSDTTAAAIPVVIMAAACFPEIQRTAQETMDVIVGQKRLPTFDDENPYINALILESYRWRPVTAGGFYHRASRDIIYNGCVIPRGATVVGNHWSISRDPSIFPDPEAFKPERWLDDVGQIRSDLRTCNFGFGRRVCPGLQVANRSLFITASCILWAFKISEDPESPIDVLAFTDTTSSHPLPFKVKFESRFPGMEQIANEATHLDY